MLNSVKTVVIFTNSRDEHAHIIVNKLNELGGKVIRVDTDRLHQFFKLHIALNKSKPIFSCVTPVGSFTNYSVNSVSIRRPFHSYEKNSINHNLVKSETYETIKTMISMFPIKTKVIDKITNIENASHKLNVLQKAKVIGLRIPDTIVTTDDKEFRAFIKKHNSDIIIKPIKSGSVYFQNKIINVPTSKLQDVNFNLVKNCPTLLQKNIHKKLELRVTVIGEKVFPVAFSVQHLPYAKFDSRLVNLEKDKIEHKLIKLPKKIEEQILKLVRFYGLHYSALDMALTFEGEYVFFELNPVGQFLWLDYVTPGLQLGKEMAKFLLSPKP